MSFLQVISAHYIEKTGRRKPQMMLFGLVGRSLWVLIPLVPLMVRNFPEIISHQQMLPVVITGVLLASACQAFTSPPFFAWMADLVPARVRPNFFAQRMRIGTIAAIITALASGFIADRYPQTEVYCALLVFAGFCGIMDIALFIGVKEPPVEMPKARRKNAFDARYHSRSLARWRSVPLFGLCFAFVHRLRLNRRVFVALCSGISGAFENHHSTDAEHRAATGHCSHVVFLGRA